MKRFLLVLLLLALLVLSACTVCNIQSYSAKQTAPGCGTISIDYHMSLPDNVTQNAVRYQVENNGAKLYITKAGAYTDENALDSNHVKTFDAATSATVTAQGNDVYRLTVNYSGLADGDYELHWKSSDMGSSDKLTVTARDKDGNKLVGDVSEDVSQDSMSPYDYKTNNNQKEYVCFRVTNNAGTPATGDGAHPLFWAIAALIGLAGIIVLSRRRIRG